MNKITPGRAGDREVEPVIRIFDCETTGLDPAVAEVCEVGVITLDAEGGISEWSALVAIDGPMPPDARAIHHISPAELADADSWSGMQAHLLEEEPADIWVAHNADFDSAMLGNPDAPWICTMKVAMRLWPEAPAFGNYALYYFLNPNAKPPKQAHRALCDAKVTLALFMRCQREATIHQMLQWTREHAHWPRCPLQGRLGQSRPWAEYDDGSLRWLTTLADRPDVVACARAELKRRYP